MLRDGQLDCHLGRRLFILGNVFDLDHSALIVGVEDVGAGVAPTVAVHAASRTTLMEP